MTALRYLGLAVVYILTGMALACLIVALAPLLLVYVVWTNWKDYTL